MGDEKTISVDIRVIAATNRPLIELVAAGRFRDDLYYRLRVVPIRLPPLRERRDDIPLLAQHFVEHYRGQTGRAIERVDQDALSLMLDYPWPGNVRELENAIEYAFVKARRGIIGPDHLPPELLGSQATAVQLAGSLASGGQRKARRPDLARDQVRQALAAAGWNVAKAARRLHASRTTLYQRMAAFKLHEPNA